jgi:hemerythrin-like metal-binding protein
MGLYEFRQRLKNPPFWLYKLLPMVYAFGGCAVLILLPNWGGRVSGGLLLVAAAQVTYMRTLGRSSGQRKRRSPDAVLVGMSWLDDYNVEHTDLDQEHMELFNLSQQILQSFVQNKGRLVDERIDELVTLLARHFKHEEFELEQRGSRYAQAHERVHRRILSKVRALHSGFKAGKVKRPALVEYLVYKAIKGHLLEEDAAMELERRRMERRKKKRETAKARGRRAGEAA